MARLLKSQLLDRILGPVTDCLTVEGARRLVELRADPELQERVDVLADKCTEGTLTAKERDEYEAYVSVANFIAILQAKARRRIGRSSAA